MTFGGKSHTKAEQARFDRIKAGPCIACLQLGIDLSGQGLVEVHHLLSGGRRRGHEFTIGLCCWSHRGVPFEFCTHEEMRYHYGPSLAEGSKPFHARFGSDAELLATQNRLLGIDDEAAA
jgi:hypothetical protein